jgi:hypothetical protein
LNDYVFQLTDRLKNNKDLIEKLTKEKDQLGVELQKVSDDSLLALSKKGYAFCVL